MTINNKKDIYGYISQLIIQVLNSRDSEGIFTFLLYMQFGIIKASSSSGSNARINLLEILGQLEEEDEKLSDEHLRIQDLFIINNDMLVSIYEDIWSRESYPPSLKWLETWKDMCTKLIRKSPRHKDVFTLLEIVKDSLKVSNLELYISLFLMKELFEQLYSETIP